MIKIIGHRGAAGLALENSPDSIKAALKLPIHGIEFDIRRTKDGKLVIMHDKHTGRVATERRRVHESTHEELKNLRLKNEQHIPALDEILELVGSKKTLVLDVKAYGVAQELSRLLAKHPHANIIVSSRKHAELEAIHKALPDVPFLLQSHLSPTEVIVDATRLRATGISINKWLINPYTYHLAKRAKLQVYVYTVNHPWMMRLITKLYPDITIFTDHPQRFIKERV